MDTSVSQSRSYRLIKGIGRVMDRYYLDPVIGMIPCAGDFLGGLFALPFLYVSLCKVRSLPLTLAVTYHILLDILLGMLPFWVGNILDFAVRSNLRNFKLITGFVEHDTAIVNEVRRKAAYMAIMIVVLILFIVLMVWLLAKLAVWVGSLWA